MGVAADLYAENDWRVLWWEMLLRSQRDPTFPDSVADAAWVAFACDSVVRHVRDAFLRRLEFLAERARVVLVLALDENDEAHQLLALLDNYLHERRNPIFATAVHVGPWSADPAMVLRDPADLMPHLGESLFEGLRQCAAVARVRTWISPMFGPRANLNGPFRTKPSVLDLVGFANYDLNRHDCPVIEIDPTGRLYVDGLTNRSLDALAVRILRYHGFGLDE
jgi:hypothetical protein